MQRHHVTTGLALAATAALAAGLGAAPAAAAPDGSGLVINEAYLSGGSAHAVFTNKFIELYNPTDAPVSLDGWSLQYRSAGGAAAASAAVELRGTVPANGYFLVSGGSNGDNGSPLPPADLATSFNPGGTHGTLYLANTGTRLTLPTGSVAGVAEVVDLLGYGGSNTFEGTAALPPAGNADPRSLNRTGAVDTDDNRADFTLSGSVTPTAAGGTGAGPDPEREPEPLPAAEKSIAEIQGDGGSTPLPGQRVTTRGVVTAAYPTGGYDGYYLQTPGTGGDDASAASHGVFVHSPATVGDVRVGDHVEATGTAGEYYGLTQLSVPAGGTSVLEESAEAVKPLTVGWPADDAGRERFEGMLWDPQGSWTVADNYALNNYGELGLAYGESSLVQGQTALPQPTDVAPAGSARAAAVAAENGERGVVLDDGSSMDYLGSDANKDIALPYVAPGSPVRVGASADFIGNVVLDYRFGAWRFQPLARLTGANAAADQPAAFEDTRTAAPAEVGGNVKLASFNVLNYFATTGEQLAGCTYYTDRDGEPVTVRGGCAARGAADAENLERQEAKIVAAIDGLGADVVTLEEIENSAAFGKDRDAALATLTAALNERSPGSWDYVRSPPAVPAGEDVIRTAFIYRSDTVRPIDESVILDDPAFSNARQPLAQTFMRVGGNSATKFVAIVNHFKSKGSPPRDGSGNDDLGDGQGAWNAARVGQAEALVAFAEEMKDHGNTDKVFLTGDFNSYSEEDPMRVLYAAGYVNQGSKTGKHSYLFGGLVGSLDHILASPAADAVVTGRDVWNINAVEPIALEYSRFNHNVVDLYEPSPYRASDHDPVIVGLQLDKHPRGKGRGARP
ncbi:MAG: ExeM/NucH family extracellular endonuclease [Arthrobacter sp.]|uniref:ExeM/NucH family extracellular endonuclease n=1 Tax=Arthrobacter sp. TaxID=1667 RepID=UPI003482BC78